MFQVYISDDHLLAIGDQINAETHSHLFSHLIVSLEDKMGTGPNLVIGNQAICCRGVMLKGQIPHRFIGTMGQHALLLIDYTSRLGNCLEQHYLLEQNYRLLSDRLVEQLQNCFRLILTQASTSASYHIVWREILSHLKLDNCAAQHNIMDKRVITVLNLLSHSGRFDHTIDELAQQIHLSPSRFSHLFKQHSGITLKSYLLFKQLISALTLIGEGTTVTRAALESGFDSPSHLSATCKRLMGIQPRLINKVSDFLKVSLFQ